MEGKHEEIRNVVISEADSGLVKVVVMTNVFFNNQEHEIEIKWFYALNI